MINKIKARIFGKKSEKGYTLMWDSLIALSFAILALMMFYSFNYSEYTSTSSMDFLAMHYASEDLLEVLNKKYVLDEISFAWSVEEDIAARDVSKRYIDNLLPKKFGYKLVIVDMTDPNMTEYVIYNSDEDPSSGRLKENESTVETHAARLLVGYSRNLPTVGSVGRAYMVIRGLDDAAFFGNETECVEPVDYCCFTPGCTATVPNNLDHGDIAVCYSENCTVPVGNNLMHNAQAVCCEENCDVDVGNNVEQNDATIACCDKNCSVSAHNNMQQDAHAYCCGDGCTTYIDARLHLKNNIRVGTCGNNSRATVLSSNGKFIQNGPNYIYCIGDDCVVDVSVGSIKDAVIYCIGSNCRVNIDGGTNGAKAYCSGGGCNITCDTCDIIGSLPADAPTNCDNACELCNIYCNYSDETPLAIVSVAYDIPLYNTYGTDNISVFYDLNRNGTADGNYTFSFSTQTPADNELDPEHDAVDDAFVRLMDKLNSHDDKNPNASVAINMSDPDCFNSTVCPGTGCGDGCRSNPIDVNSSDLTLGGIHSGAIRSLWGPVKVSLVLWM